MTTTMTPYPRRHRVAVRPTTGEQPTVFAPALVAMAAGHLTAGIRDARRELQEALAACQDLADNHLAVRQQLFMNAALDPRVDEGQVIDVGLILLTGASDGHMHADEAIDLLVGMLEGWQLRQDLAPRGGAR